MIGKELPAMVIDCGSHTCKSGFSSDKAPCSVLPSTMGYLRQPSIRDFLSLKEYYIGEEAQCKRGVLPLRYPIDNGIVTNWEDMEKMLHHIMYKELRVNPENHPVWYSEPLLNPKRNREILAELFFELFNIPSMYLNPQTVLSLYSAGVTTGCVFDSGDSFSQSACIYEGYISSNDFRLIELAGRDVTDYLVRLLFNRGYRFTTAAEREIVRDIKERLAYVPIDCKQEMIAPSSNRELTYELPDGQVVSLEREHILCSQALFQPSLIGMKSEGIHNMIYNNIKNSELDCRNIFYGNIVIAGGNTMYPGMCERLQKEISKLAPGSMKVRVISPKNRKYSSWNGGSVLSSLTGVHYSECLSKREYDEHGPKFIMQ